MRKYVQLILVVVAVASISLMLLYERKYSKMKMILEILNGFNYKEVTLKPQPSEQPTHEPYFISNPSWTYLTDSLYLYSAYCQNVSESNELITLVLATSISVSDTSDLQCYLWYEGYPEALVGKVKVIKYASESSAFFISCSHVGTNIVPYGITIFYKSINSSFIPVTAIANPFETAVCLETLPMAFQDAFLLAEFLIFYQHTGINYFIIYEKGLSPIARRLVEYAKRIGYQLDILYWNYPAGELGKDAQILDCFARSFLVHGVSSVAILKLGQFLVPKSASNLTDAIGRTEGISSYKFNTYHFCSEYPIDVVAETLNFPFVSLKYTKRLNKKEDSAVLVYQNSITTGWNYQQISEKAQVVPASDVMLYVYGNCHLLPHHINTNYSEDLTMIRYKNIFFLSPLYHYLEK